MDARNKSVTQKSSICFKQINIVPSCTCGLRSLCTSAVDSDVPVTGPLLRRFESRWTSCSTPPTTGPPPQTGAGARPSPHYCPGRDRETVLHPCPHSGWVCMCMCGEGLSIFMATGAPAVTYASSSVCVTTPKLCKKKK